MIKSITKISIIIFLFTFTTLHFAAGNKKHHVGVFAGATSNLYLEHTYFTLGVDYEYRLNHSFGLGLIGDYVMADHAETLLMGGIFYHPISSLKIYVGNGVALLTEVNKATEHEDNNESEGEEKSVSYYVFRLGTGYDFHVSGFSVTPTVAWDLINGHSSIVYGLTFGIGF
ncbi:MAG: hypothetical protein L3J41_00560 [Melioribacteraceae bacterium]|nr:hypothetical protein [Melioribacteraceae bacterium]